MNRRSFRAMAVGLLSAAALSVAAIPPTRAADSSSRQPNIVFFLVDDLGWSDLGVFGSSFHETPQIDRLAAGGMRFTNAYAACPVCSPTRASILTGRHPVRVEITDWIPGLSTSRIPNPRFQHIDDRNELALEEVTLAEVLREHDYQSCFAGKWHLGGEGFLPTDQGFDINIGGFHVGSPPGGYYAPWSNPYLQEHHEGEYLTDRLTDESLAFIRDRDPNRPFLLYLSYYNVHTPIQADRKSVEHFRSKAERLGPSPPESTERGGRTRMRQDNPDYASMVAAVDRSVGRVLDALEERQLDDNTVICFFSDNGGLSTIAPQRQPAPTCNAPLRSGKGWLYEGGIREPMIIRAPGITRPGSVCDVPVCSMDFFPTLLQLAGLPLQPEQHADGISLLPLLTESGAIPSRTLYWHYPHYHGSAWTPGAALRDGRWKLIEFYESGDVELYDLQTDIGERRDLSRMMPERVRTLRQKLKHWQEASGAQMPQPNPDWTPPPSDHPVSAAAPARSGIALLDKENLAAWCIVPFDSSRRSPQQRAEMVQRLGLTKVAYDWFHHGHEHMDGFAEHFRLMRPYLLCVNINGMADADTVRRGQDKILPPGRGQHERAMLQVVVDSGWSGPIGILDHRPDRDSEEVLRENLAGLEQLKTELAP